ncbi:unnamed protein product [Chironomus riparius]|uniref:DRBM domain-containing protein n=1 Tax=Chironomus riparius TaxID=315576 RepID=A0A9N9RLM1_9DIPT|nr:unnamed protein product [Chironomus riparius]
MIHPHNHHMHPINVSQPPPQHMQQQQNMSQTNPQRMNHHHYQQRLSHQQIQQHPQQHHNNGNRNLNGINQHQVPPLIPKQHLHQNIATLNQKPPQHVNNNQSSQNSQIQPSIVSSRLSYESMNAKQHQHLRQASNKIQISESINNNNLSESSSSSVPHSATATLPINNSSIVTGSTNSIITVPPPLSHHHHQQTNILPNYQHQKIDLSKSSDKSSTPIVSANKENIPVVTASSLNNSTSSSQGIILSNSATEIISAENTEKGIESLANAKEKTPMCLVNELARFNKIEHQYRLVSEQGPAHKKRFTVILKLGDEEYAAEGLSIKKAQHAAAKDAIIKTSYKHPPLKTNRLKSLQSAAKGNSNITPTVELNALAMKRGEPTVYTVLSSTVNPPVNPQYGQQQTPQFNGIGRGNPYQRRFNSQRGGGNRFNSSFSAPEIFHIALQVGTRTFSGMGPTQQAARHDAAARALEVLKPLTSDSDITQKLSTSGSTASDLDDADDSLINSDIKSPISIVHEMALKRKLTVSFEVQSEKGPPHMKVYTTLCKVGTIVTEGEGNGKKLSKKKAAEKMMDELKKLPPPSPVEEPINTRGNTKGRRKQLMTQQQQPTSNFQVVKKKTRNLIKEKLEQSTNADEINPISQLIQIQQARKEKEPTYVVVDERGTARRREFVIEVSVSGYSANGTGPNKKLAKKIAAENLLIAMGVNASKPVTETPIIEKKKMIDMSDKAKKVQFNEPDAGKKTPAKSTSGSGGRQIVPGLLLVSNTETFSTPTKPVATTSSSTPSKETSSLQSNDHPTATEKQSSSPNSNASNADSGIGENGVSPRDQLNYLAQLIGFSVSYADFPKANHTEFLSLVTLSTDPPHMGHGNGSTVDESRDSAALKALSVISELGIDNVKPKGSK